MLKCFPPVLTGRIHHLRDPLKSPVTEFVVLSVETEDDTLPFHWDSVFHDRNISIGGRRNGGQFIIFLGTVGEVKTFGDEPL